MNCVRCGKNFQDDIPTRNVESFGNDAYFSCPHCGKLYRFSRKIDVSAVPDEDFTYDEDEWGKRIVKDCEYHLGNKL